VKSSAIEGEKLNQKRVRSSIAKRLGLETSEINFPDENMEGIVEMLFDATHNYTQTLSEERLFTWHSVLFPSSRSRGKYRKGEMQALPGTISRNKTPYRAIEAKNIKAEMDKLINWVNESSEIDLVIKSAIAHLWFIAIHPFDYGNGRIARAISDMLLARSDGSSQRFYSMSCQILKEKNKYYITLRKTLYGGSDITHWLNWYLDCLKNSIINAETTSNTVSDKAEFWKKHAATSISERQRLMINVMLDGFYRELKSSRWAKITNTSSDTAVRDMKDLIEKGILKQNNASGRSTNYTLIS
jgi:Fic family protein